MSSQGISLVTAIPLLLVGLAQAPAFAQTIHTDPVAVSTESKATTDESSKFLRYLSPEYYHSMLPDQLYLTNNYSITKGTDSVITSSEQLVDTLTQEFRTLGRTTVKAVTFETMSAALEAGLFVTFFGGSIVTAGGIFVVSFLSSTAVYVVHEYAWEHLAPTNVPATAPERIASKAATYRALSVLRTFAVGNIFGGADEVAESLGFALSVAALDTALYGAIEYSFESLFASVDEANKKPTTP